MAESPHADRFEAFAASFVKEHRLPGAAVGVVTGGELIWSAGVGFADLASHRRPEASTLYRIASITKTLTGTAIMQLRATGRLRLDDPVVSFLPELAAGGRRAGAIENVTIRRLLSHESGLRSEPPGTDWAIPRYEGDVKRTLTHVEEIGAVIPPNRQWKYSNLGYQLLGEVIARVSGTPYTDYVKKKILQPLAMSSTSFEPLPKRLATRVATGYAGRTFSDELEVAPAMPAIFAEGGLWSCVKDSVELARLPARRLSRRCHRQARDRSAGPEHRGPEGDAQAPLYRRRRVDLGLGDLLVRRAQGRRHLDPALWWAARTPDKRVL